MNAEPDAPVHGISDRKLALGIHFVLRALWLEQWLRFYWLSEDGDMFRIHLPQEERGGVEAIPELTSLLAVLERQPVSASGSVQAVLDAAEQRLGKELAREVLNHPSFQSAAGWGQAWVHEQREALEQTQYSFPDWEKALQAILAEHCPEVVCLP